MPCSLQSRTSWRVECENRQKQEAGPSHFPKTAQEKWPKSEITGKTNESGCAPGWMPVVRVYIPNYHERLSSGRIKLREMVTLAYIQNYIWLVPGSTRPLANGNAQKYYRCVDRADSTCAVSIVVVIKGQEDTLCCNCSYTNRKQRYLDLLTQNRLDDLCSTVTKQHFYALWSVVT